jgi:alpha-mannosidase
MQSAIRETLPPEDFVYRAGWPGIRGAHDNGATWSPVHAGLWWGGAEAWATFRISFRVPQSWSDGPVRLLLQLGGQGLAYLDGVPWQGLDRHHQYMKLPANTLDDRLHEVVVEAYAIAEATAPRLPGTLCMVGECVLQRLDPDAAAYGYDLQVGAETLHCLPPDHPVRRPLLDLLLATERRVDRRQPGSAQFTGSVREARTMLADGLTRLAQRAGSDSHVLAMGHAHIDTAWLWPLSQTHRKVVRSWSTVLRLMEQYPDFHFLASQAQHYEWLEADEPALYQQVEARIREGRWEPAAAMWVEPDVNLTAGESLVRQFLYGQHASLQRFGRRCEVLWLPDTFGYSGALPQIMRSAGVHTIVTSKLSWNATNRMPHDTFRWRGLDGTDVLAFFITAIVDAHAEPEYNDPDHPLRLIATYNGHLTPPEVASAWTQYRDKALSDTVLYPFGWGDGGGGPTAEMLEVAERLAAYPGLPALRQGAVGPFLRQLHDRLMADPLAPVWDGEMYLEYHRGVYTSQAGVKAGNRRGEHALHDAELWTALAVLQGAAASQWKAQLDEAWKLLLLNQFHDILPGSSIAEVYVDQAAQHARVQELAATVRQEAQAIIADRIARSEDNLVVFSGLPWAREDIVVERALLQDQAPIGDNDQPLPAQQITDLRGRDMTIIGGATMPALGYSVLRLGPLAAAAPTSLAVSERSLENSFFRIELDGAGQMARLLDKRFQREVLAPGGGGNQLLAFEDKPLDFDAWDIDAFYAEKGWPIDHVRELRVVERGPLRAGVEIRRDWDGSTVTQRILIYEDLPRIDFETSLDWHHHQVLVKAAFPFNLRVTRARYECAFGWVERPTHRNTSWDAARFEVAGHRWADVSETDYGVSLINDSKYGHDCLGATLRLTLLKSAISPDPEADLGTHHFAYALLPHGPTWAISDTVRAAYAFNLPVTATRGVSGAGSLPPMQALVQTNSRHAVIDTVKIAEDGDGIIVRIYDCSGGREQAELQFAQPIREALAVTILEDPDTAGASPVAEGDRLRFDLPPFGLRSFRVHLG